MARPISFGRFDVQLTSGEPADLTPRENRPLRMLVLANLGGRPRPDEWRPIRVDRDNFDTLPGRLNVTLTLPELGPSGRDLELPIAEVEDFRPERLRRNVAAFDRLRSLRERLGHPSTFQAAAAEVHSWNASAAPEPEPPPPSSGAELLERLIGGPLEPAAPLSPEVAEWNTFLRRAVAPHLAPSVDPRQADLTRQVDEASAALLRAILHHPRFQAIEAAWRGIAFLVRRLDTDEAIHLFVLDVSQEELAADLLGGEELARTKAHALLARPAGGGPVWDVVVADYRFRPTVADAELLGRIARIAARWNTVFLAEADPQHVGCTSLVASADPADWNAPPDPDGLTAWSAVRGLPEATHLGLALPRFLLRAPYGKEGAEVEGFPFEETVPDAKHESFLWGNPAFAWACLLGEAYSRGNGRVSAALSLELADLPAALVERRGERELVPCAEVILTDRAAKRILAAGIAPLRSIPGANRVQFESLPSITFLGHSLAGRWH